MSYIFRALKLEYVRDLASARIHAWRVEEAHDRAGKILPLKPRYERIANQTGVPVIWIMAINERESGSKMRTYLGNGQALNRRTTLVPKGRGPFKSWEAGALDALRLGRVDQVKDWSWPRMMYEAERYNGFGPRMHKRKTGYLWAGTNLYKGGKYIADRRWDPKARDIQLGCWPIMKALVALDPSLDIDGHPAEAQAIASLPPDQHKDLEIRDMLWVQHALNAVMDAGLYPDGSWGRHTAAATAAFQEAHGLVVNGVPGDDTKAALAAILAAEPIGEEANGRGEA